MSGQVLHEAVDRSSPREARLLPLLTQKRQQLLEGLGIDGLSRQRAHEAEAWSLVDRGATARFSRSILALEPETGEGLVEAGGTAGRIERKQRPRRVDAHRATGCMGEGLGERCHWGASGVDLCELGAMVRSCGGAARTNACGARVSVPRGAHGRRSPRGRQSQ